jgi:hypothetical protein
MSDRSTNSSSRRLLARGAVLALLVVTVAGVVGGLVLGVHLTLDTSVLPAFLAYALVGAVLAWQRPTAPLGWIFLAVGLLAGLQLLASGVADRGLADLDIPSPPAGRSPGWVDVELTPWLTVALVFLSGYWLVMLSLSTTITVLFFPTAPRTRAWRLVTAVAALGVAVMVLAPATAAYVPLDSNWDRLTPNSASIGLPYYWWSLGSPVFVAAAVVVLVCGVARVIAMVVDFRRSSGPERLQLRWFAWAAALFVPLSVLSGNMSEPMPVAAAVLTFVTFLLIPTACAVAVLRYHLYDIDRVVSRTAAYAVVTALVLAAYAGVVTLASALVPDKSSQLPVATATLVAAALFRPVLRRVQRWVDRRFDRARYDAERTVEEFSHRLRTQHDSRTTSDDLVDVIGTTVAPSSVSLWLRSES